jgi:hypothetical protein
MGRGVGFGFGLRKSFYGGSLMKKLAIALLFCGVSAFAGTVTYSTTGDFTSTGTATVSNGGETIAFTGSAGSVSTPTFTSVGSFLVTGSASGTFSDSFTLTILQSVPSGSGTTATPISGTITGNSSTIAIAFAPSTLAIGGADWTFANIGLNNPSIDGGKTVLVEQVTLTPEPGSLALLGGSLLGFGLLARRRLVK